MIDIPVYNEKGEQVGSYGLDESLVGGEVRFALLKQAYVRQHGNRRQGSAATKTRSETEGSTKKLYKQKGTGRARRGPIRTNVMRGGGHGHAKKPKSWRVGMPNKMRRLANRNALLAKAVDGEIKLIEGVSFDEPSTKRFAAVLRALNVDRTCLVAVAETRDGTAKSAANIADVTVTHVDRLNAFDLLNHRYLVADKEALAGWVRRGTEAGAA